VRVNIAALIKASGKPVVIEQLGLKRSKPSWKESI